MSKLHRVPDEFAAKARIRAADYEELYAESVRDPEGFWGRIGRRLGVFITLLAGPSI